MLGHTAKPVLPTDTEPPNIGRRGASRARLALPARAVTFDGTASCMILNASQTGAQIGCEEVPKLGSMIVIEIAPIEFFGNVAWVSDQRFGIAFDEPLAFETVVELRRRADTFDQTERRRLLKVAEEFVQGRVKLS